MVVGGLRGRTHANQGHGQALKVLVAFAQATVAAGRRVLRGPGAGRGRYALLMPLSTRFKIPESVLVVIHTPDLQVLLIERADHPGFWQSVTGSKDTPQEAPAETARREVLEETGFDIDAVGGELRDWQLANVYEIYPQWRHRYAPGVTRNTEHVFGLQLPEALTPRLSPREHLSWLWLPWREAADRCFSPSNAEAVLQLRRFGSAATTP
jgi:dATP pyrophosphohydrolase